MKYRVQHNYGQVLGEFDNALDAYAAAYKYTEERCNPDDDASVFVEVLEWHEDREYRKQEDGHVLFWDVYYY